MCSPSAEFSTISVFGQHRVSLIDLKAWRDSLVCSVEWICHPLKTTVSLEVSVRWLLGYFV